MLVLNLLSSEADPDCLILLSSTFQVPDYRHTHTTMCDFVCDFPYALSPPLPLVVLRLKPWDLGILDKCCIRKCNHCPWLPFIRFHRTADIDKVEKSEVRASRVAQWNLSPVPGAHLVERTDS